MPVNQLFESIQGEYERLTKDELTNVGVVLGAYRSFRGDRRSHVAYIGMPITTGKRYFDVLSENGVKTREELIEKLGPKSLWELVIQPNIAEGIAFADRLGETRDLLFIAPSVFEAKQWRWSQDAYMSLWYRVIGEMAGSHFVMDGWEYSVGGVKEVMFSMLLQWAVIRCYNRGTAYDAFGLPNFHPNLPWEKVVREFMAMRKICVYDSKGKEIPIDVALAKSVGAINDLKERGFSYEELIGPATTIMQTPFFSPFANGENEWGYNAFTPLYQNAKAQLKALSNES